MIYNIPSWCTSWSEPVPWSTSASIWNICKIVICCWATVVGDTIVPCHGREPFPMKIIAMSSAFTSPIWCGLMSSYVCMMSFLLVTFLFAPVSFCIISVKIRTVILFLGVVVIRVTLMVALVVADLSCSIASMCTLYEWCCVSLKSVPTKIIVITRALVAVNKMYRWRIEKS